MTRLTLSYLAGKVAFEEQTIFRDYNGHPEVLRTAPFGPKIALSSN